MEALLSWADEPAAPSSQFLTFGDGCSIFPFLRPGLRRFWGQDLRKIFSDNGLMVMAC